MKYLLVIVIFLFSIGCSEKNNITEEQHTITIPFDSSNEVFELKGIKYDELEGNWNLVNAQYKCTLGKLEHIENNYGFSENEKIMSLGDNGIHKICFWRKPEFVVGAIGKEHEEFIESFVWTPGGGAPTFYVLINYSNGKLTLSYSSTILIDNKYYDGIVYEIYAKR